jgi:hypothetical protein
MPLLDHFHPPLSDTRHWESFHARWASAIADALNEDLLPEGYYAEEQVHVGGRVEIDVATFEPSPHSGQGGTATAPARVWAPPGPNLFIPAVFPDRIEVLVFSGEGGPTLVAAVELVSPGNKDRDEARHSFAIKCASYLQQGIGLVVVDTVTSRQANLHNDLMRLLGNGPEARMPPDPLYAAAYRPVRRTDADEIEGWTRSLRIGQVLPVMPLALDKQMVLPLDLESTYSEARSRRRMPE